MVFIKRVPIIDESNSNPGFEAHADNASPSFFADLKVEREMGPRPA